MFGPGVDVAMIIYSEGWGPEGLGAALLYIVQMPDETYIWNGMVLSFERFDKLQELRCQLIFRFQKIALMSGLKKLPSRSWEEHVRGCGLHPHPRIPVLFSRLTFLQWSH
jgi:hypothetical protein